MTDRDYAEAELVEANKIASSLAKQWKAQGGLPVGVLRALIDVLTLAVAAKENDWVRAELEEMVSQGDVA